MATAFAAKEVEDENVATDSGNESGDEVEEAAAAEAGDSAAESVAESGAAEAALEREYFFFIVAFLLQAFIEVFVWLK